MTPAPHPPLSARISEPPARPTTLNSGPGDPRHLKPPQERALERRLQREVMHTIRETFGRD